MESFGIVELVGVVFGILYVWLAIRESVWCWPAGLANALLFLVVFSHARLYGSAALQGLYLWLSIYGWHQWLRGGEGQGRLAVARSPARSALALGAAAFLATAGFWGYLRFRTDAALPLPDAATTAFSLAAQWMTTRKWIESWLVWIAVDVVYVVMYLSQRLYLTAALYLVFLVMAGLGYREWHRSLVSTREPDPRLP